MVDTSRLSSYVENVIKGECCAAFLFNAVWTIKVIFIFGKNGNAKAQDVEPLVASVACDPILTTTLLALKAYVFISTVVVRDEANLIL